MIINKEFEISEVIVKADDAERAAKAGSRWRGSQDGRAGTKPTPLLPTPAPTTKAAPRKRARRIRAGP